MSQTALSFLGRPVPVHPAVFDTLIVGTGAAACNAAVHLFDRGVANIALLTEDRLGGTSRNTGSDKQTYYKAACAGAMPDTPQNMAKTLFAGGSMDGDSALCEAAHSLQEFFHLVAIGVDFPHNRYGEFVGYKTDHDPLERASSTGPYTSRQMTERLEAEAARRGIRCIDKTRVVKLLAAGNDRNAPPRAYGVLCLEGGGDFQVYLARYLIFATGGPAGLYRETVYPPGHFGASGVLAREGVEFANITEWQYGIGSTKFRWNLSGSYQQVVPRYVSVDAQGREQEFLCEYFPGMEKLCTAVFLKGYQWPFDPAKLDRGGSSRIDCAVYREKYIKGNRVYLDFMHNPAGGGTSGPFSLDRMGQTAYDYLARSDALVPAPVERLLRLNPQAYALYKTHGIDLAKEYLEIDVLPQHHNGGAAVNIWWETSVNRLFAIGECAGTHGVKRPGGSALNAGQVGGLRAAEYISWHMAQGDSFFDNPGAVMSLASGSIAAFEKELAAAMPNIRTGEAPAANAGELLCRLQSLNSTNAAFLRSREQIAGELSVIEALEREPVTVADRLNGGLPEIFHFKEILLLSRLLCQTILFYIEQGGKSRGSYLVLDAMTGDIPVEPELDTAFHDKVLCSHYDPLSGQTLVGTRPVRPIPAADTWFERVWREYTEGFMDNNPRNAGT
jgi:succinate dehydrogenase/fumarate reductase flavoprotein subunit